MRSSSSPPRWKAFRSHVLLGLAAILVLIAGGLAVAQDRTITTAVSIAQDQLAAGAYTTNQVVQSGRQFFAVPFLKEDGHGEGDAGPRSGQRSQQWAGSTTDPLSIPFLRVNGLDSQSCFACHNSAGTYVPKGELYRTQKPGQVGGAGDFAVALLQDNDYPNTLSHILRVPPRVFGSAYLQELALEMTGDLQGIQQQAIQQAKLNPGKAVTLPLSSKTVSFGSITITCPDSTCANPTRDTSAVQGVSPDLIVRPFQHKGVAATLRSFTKSALNFHHSMQAVEVVGINTDCDGDGLINELAVDNVNPVPGVNTVPVQQSLGNVAALVAFTGMLRPPAQAPTSTSGTGLKLFNDIGCGKCHVNSLTTRPDPQFRIQLAQPAAGCPTNCGPYGCQQLGSFAEADAPVHPALLAVQGQAELAGTSRVCPTGFYCIDLTNPGSLPPEFFPRLPANPDSTVAVPLFSDLRRHDMGKFLAQVDPKQADDAGTPIPNREWLTSKLWGVVDNGPWIHDGRARSLKQAILMHAGPDGTATDSEASPVIASFRALSASDQQAIIDFLETLTIPNP
jgi:hypothetical protein